MLLKDYRGESFIDRDKEIEFFLDYFKQNPKRILWIYGPKSTGKTTLIEYVVENYLIESSEYNVKYVNFRRSLVTNYDTFLNSFIKPKDNKFFNSLDVKLKLKFIEIDTNLYKKIEKKELDLFDGVQKEFLESSKNRKNILIIDEIQSLQDIYINGGKLLLNEFLNFCVALTKELHISHVLILTSNTIFLNKIYNSAKMKVTSSFRLIEHLPFNAIKEWLNSKDLGFNLEDTELIYEYFGGSVAHIKKMIDEYKNYNSLKEYLEEMADIAKNEIKLFFEQQKITKEEKERFLFVADKIVKDGKFINGDYEGYLDIVSKFAEVEILFYEPIKNITTANSKIYAKAFEKIIEEQK